jgi:hypothetical protein
MLPEAHQPRSMPILSQRDGPRVLALAFVMTVSQALALL